MTITLKHDDIISQLKAAKVEQAKLANRIKESKIYHDQALKEIDKATRINMKAQEVIDTSDYPQLLEEEALLAAKIAKFELMLK